MNTPQLHTSFAQPSDIEKIVDVHMLSFEKFFLTSLGRAFLNLYYNSVREHPEGILLKCEHDGQLVGFCAATIHAAGFNWRLVRSHPLKFSIMAVRLLINRPKSLWHLFRNFSKEKTDKGDHGGYAELLSIGVNPSIQNTGAGKHMLITLEKIVKEQGATKLSLTTDYIDNKKTIGFYDAMGYKVWYDFITYPSRHMYRLIKTLS